MKEPRKVSSRAGNPRPVDRESREALSLMVAAGRPPEPVKAAFKREQGLFSRQQYGRALVLLADLLARPKLTPRQRFEALCRKAECLESLKRPRAAVELLREMVRAYPGEPLGFSLLGEYLYRVNEDSRGALAMLKRALRLAPKDPDTLWWTGQVWQYGRGDLGRARRYYSLALEVDPRYPAAQDSLASLFEARGMWVDAIDWRKRHYRLTRQAADLVSLAGLYLKLDNPAAARKYARSAVRRDPRNAGAWLELAKAGAALGRKRTTVEALGRFSRLAHPKSGPFVSARDFAFLETIVDLPAAQALLSRLPAQ
jgi:tetratricopeptide (TPR) repeat protein